MPLTLWLDGKLEDSDEDGRAVHDGAAPFMVGAERDDTGIPSAFFEGRVDEVRVSSVARYGEELTPDASGNGNDGALKAGALIADGGRFDKGLALDGVDDHVEVPDSNGTLDITGDFTIEAWIKPTTAALTGTPSIVARWTPPADNKKSYRLYLEDGIPTLDLSSNGTSAYTLSGTQALLADEWTHVAATRAGSTVKLIVNGAEVASGTYGSSLHEGDAALMIGADGYGNHFAGVIDEVRVSSADRTASLGKTEVHYRYNERNQLTMEYAGAYVAEPSDPPPEVTVRRYFYDRNGNVTLIEEKVGAVTIATEAMSYDALNRMTSHTGPKGTETTSYRGAEWHRFSQSANGAGKAFLYDGDNVLADIAGGSTDAFYVTPFLDQNLSITTGETPETYYYSQDGLGSVRTLTDSSGGVKNRYDYTPFGGQHQPGTNVAVEQRYTYTGREKNPASDLMYYRYRQYDPRVGRYGGRDPLGYDDRTQPERTASVRSIEAQYGAPMEDVLREAALREIRRMVRLSQHPSRMLGSSLYEYVRGNPHATGDPLGMAPDNGKDPTPKEYFSGYTWRTKLCTIDIFLGHRIRLPDKITNMPCSYATVQSCWSAWIPIETPLPGQAKRSTGTIGKERALKNTERNWRTAKKVAKNDLCKKKCSDVVITVRCPGWESWWYGLWHAVPKACGRTATIPCN